MSAARRLGAAAAALALLLLLTVAGARPAAADSIQIRAVDTTAFPKVKATVVVNGEAPDPSLFNIVEDKKYVQAISAVATGRSDRPLGLAIVMDTSASMRAADRIGQSKRAALDLIAAKRPDDRVAIIATGQRARTVQAFTADAAALTRAVSSLDVLGPSAMRDGIALAAGLFADPSAAGDLQANIVVLGGPRDTASTSRYEAVRGTVLSSKAVVFGIGLAAGTDFDPIDIEQLARTSGGTYQEDVNAAAASAMVQRVQSSLANQFEIVYASKATKPFDLTISVGQLIATAPAVTPDALSAGNQLKPKVVTPTPGFGPFGGSAFAWVTAALVLSAVAAAAYAVVSIVAGSSSGLDKTLQAYTVGGARDREDDDAGNAISNSAVVQRAVTLTEQFASDRGVLATLERRLEQADIQLRPGEILAGSLAAIVLVAIGLTIAFGQPLIFLVVLFVGLLAVPAVINFLAGRRRKKFVSGLPDMLNLLASTLRAGFSLLQALDAVVKEIEEPLRKEMSRVLVEAQLGREVDEALADCAVRMESPDFDWCVMAINIQREVGGNLAELLDTVADTMVQRERLRRDVSALTAEGRMSAIVLGLLPVGLGGAMAVINPDYISKLVTTGTGNVLLGASVAAALFGFWWMKKIITIDI